MPEHLRALVVIVGVSLLTFWSAKQPMSPLFGGGKQYSRDRNLWLLVTFIAFFSSNYTLYAVLFSLLLLWQSKRHEAPLAIYCLFALALPDLTKYVPGVRPFAYLMALTNYRLLSLFLLLPVAIRIYASRAHRGATPSAVDLPVIGLFLWMLAVQAANDSFTDTIRTAFYFFLDMWLPYYVSSRLLTKIEDFHRIAGALIVASMVIAMLALFESGRRWLLYPSLQTALGLDISGARIALYKFRGEGGPLRPTVTLGAITIGYMMVLALALMSFIAPRVSPRWKRWAITGLLLAGLIVSLSRGPWVGGAAMLVVLTALGPGLGKRIMWAILGGGVAVLGLLASPWGTKVVSYLPFVGTVESDTVDYRSRLFGVSMRVFRQHPIVGDLGYLQNPLMEQMRQGEGIIDMVNSYLQIALPYGSIGLFLFASVFIGSLLGVWRVRNQVSDLPEVDRLGRALIAALIGILVIIATVSSVSAIPTMYWLAAGLCASYVRIYNVRKKDGSLRIPDRSSPVRAPVNKITA